MQKRDHERILGAAKQVTNWQAGLVSRSPEETAVMAGVFAGLVPDNTVLALSGGLGAGKTAFVRGMAVAFGVNAPVSSPSYAIFNLHEGRRIQLAHVDAYRLVEPEEFDALALWELLEEPWVLVVEWPENLGNRLPAETWWMDCAIEGQDVRRFRLRGT